MRLLPLMQEAEEKVRDRATIMGDRKDKSNSAGILLAFLTGASLAATTLLLWKRVREGSAGSLDGILDRCDKAASALDDRLKDGKALAS